MKGSRFSEEQIIGVLREHGRGKERRGKPAPRISSATLYKWKAKYGGLEVSEARRLKSEVRKPMVLSGPLGGGTAMPCYLF